MRYATAPALLLALGFCGILHAEDSNGETAPLIQPISIVTPQLPGSGSDADADPKLAAQRKLAELAALHARRIAEIDSALANTAPVTVPDQVGLDDERRERDAALLRARTGAQNFVAKTRADTRDPISSPATAAPRTQNEGILGTNRLAAADCYRQLVLDGQGGAPELVAGADVLSRVDVAQLPAAELPRLLYLRVWFSAEQARHATDESARTRFTTSANEAQQILLRDFPTSELTRTAQQVVRELGRGAAQ